MNSKLRFGIVGAGFIAEVIAKAIEQSEVAQLTAVSSRRRETAETFAQRHGDLQVFDSAAQLAASEHVDAVYVATPTAAREAACLAAAQNKKHLLAEKPFASLQSLQTITKACRDNGVAFMDATHFSHHPRTHLLKSEMAARIGRLLAIHTSFFFPSSNPENIRFDPQKEPTGAIGDMAWYSMRAAIEFMPSDLALVQTKGYAQKDPQTGAVVRGAGSILFSDGSTATWNAGYTCGALIMDLDILGDQGQIHLDDFVLDWAYGIDPSTPDFPVGFTQRSGISKPDEFIRVSTPSSRPQTVRMIEDFTALANNPTGAAVQASIQASERTQSLLDSVWDQMIFTK